MTPVKVCCLCGTGVVGASVVAEKLRNAFAQRKVPLQMVTGSSLQVDTLVKTGQVDMIVATSIMPRNYGVPAFHAIAFLTGIGEKELLQEIVDAAEKIWQERAAGE